jgi:hypothetical protein
MAVNSDLHIKNKSNTIKIRSGDYEIEKSETGHTIESRVLAQYIADMVLELRAMAKADDFKTLQGLLEISFYEAFSLANRVKIPEREIEFLHKLQKASVA